jgi:DNA-binding NtrC family response regulator
MDGSGRKIHLLVVDDDDAFRELLVTRFSTGEFMVTGASTGEEALELTKQGRFDLGVIDIRMPGLSGVELLRKIKEIQPEFEAVMLTGKATIDSAIESMKLGAYDYLAKPCKLFELEMILRKAFEKKMLAEHNIKLREELRRKIAHKEILGDSKNIKNLHIQIGKVAQLQETALVVGELGAGKQLIASTIHRQSPRKNYPFTAIHCGVLSEGQLAAELFGAEDSSFSGGELRRRGLLEFAEPGSVYLDGVEQLTSAMQVKLLHFLDTGEFCRVGGFSDIYCDTRLIFGTAENLMSLAQQGKFREDLYYKISTLTINAPPLREHKDDIPAIAESIMADTHLNAGKSKRLAKKAVEALMEYNWPGNVRELQSVLERAISLSEKQVIQLKDLPLSFEKKSRSSKNRHLMSLQEIEREHILFVLDAVSGNISKAAKILEISRPKLYRKIEKYKGAPSA